MSRGRTTRLTMLGQAGRANRDLLGNALSAVAFTDTTRVELDLAELDSCDVDAAFELTAFAIEVRDRGGQVALVSANPWVLTMLRLADVADAVAMPAPGPSAPAAPRSTIDVSPGQDLAVRLLLSVLDDDDADAGPGPVEVSRALTDGDDSPAANPIA